MTQEVESGTGIGRVLHFHSDAPLPHGSQHLGWQPLSPVSSAHHHNFYSGLQHPEEREAFFRDVLVGSYVPLHHRVREQRAGPKHAISVDHEAAAAVAVDVRGVRGLALQQSDARPLIQLVIRWREPMPTPWGPQQIGQRTAESGSRTAEAAKDERGDHCEQRAGSAGSQRSLAQRDNSAPCVAEGTAQFAQRRSGPVPSVSGGCVPQSGSSVGLHLLPAPPWAPTDRPEGAGHLLAGPASGPQRRPGP